MVGFNAPQAGFCQGGERLEVSVLAWMGQHRLPPSTGYALDRLHGVRCGELQSGGGGFPFKQLFVQGAVQLFAQAGLHKLGHQILFAQLALGACLGQQPLFGDRVARLRQRLSALQHCPIARLADGAAEILHGLPSLGRDGIPQQVKLAAVPLAAADLYPQHHREPKGPARLEQLFPACQRVVVCETQAG